MPEEEYQWLPRKSILDYEEIGRLVTAFSAVGVSKVRITGGEPLLRRDLPKLVALLRANPLITDRSITTNGILLAQQAEGLFHAGLDRVTVSLDTLRPERFRELAGRARLEDVLGGIDAARTAGFENTKVNSVVVRGFNDDELIDLLEFGRLNDVEIRFIEYMDVGGATRWSMEEVISRREILDRIAEVDDGVRALNETDDQAAPAERFELRDGTRFGIIASTTAPFGGTCGRSRLTADGMWFLCLYADAGVDLKGLLRSGASDEELAAVIREAWANRQDRGAETRLSEIERSPLHVREELRQDPHREMHTRGG
jgi:cyclic pyranopterin phosphate synthase